MNGDTAPDRVFAALGNAIRWRLLRLLADGQALPASAMAQHCERDFDGVSKHLKVLRAAGLLDSRQGADRRLELYFVPERFRKYPGLLDFGCCTVRVPEGSEEAPLGQSPANRIATREKPATLRTEGFGNEEEAVPQGFGEMLARMGTLPRALGGPMERGLYDR